MKQIFENPVLAGGIGLMLSGAAMYLLRSIPAQLWAMLSRRVISELTVTSNSPAYYWTEEWLASKPFAKKTRVLKLSQAADNDKKIVLAVGYGKHMFFNGCRPIWVKREVSDKKVGQQVGPGSSDERIVITTLDVTRASIEKIFAEIRDAVEARKLLRVLTCSSWGFWFLLLKREHRSMSSIFVKKSIKDRITNHIEWYLANKKWYTEHGIPYRTGILLYGPPGTGKTSLVHAIAGVFDLSVYVMNPADLESESALKAAMASIAARSILLIEDADECIGSRKVEKECEPSSDRPALMSPPTETKAGPSLSGVLNALDGIVAADGRILIMTTNHKERLDPALIRDGRIDMRIEIGPLEREEAIQMAVSFFPERSRSDLAAMIDSQPTKTGAEWQTYFAELTKPAY